MIDYARKIAWNKAQNYSRAFWRTLQAFLLVGETGEPDSATIDAIYELQKDLGITQDGGVGSETRCKLLEIDGAPEVFKHPHPAPPKVEVGVWMDLAPSVFLSGSHAQRMASMGITVCALMLDSSRASGVADYKYSVDEAVAACELLRSVGIKPILTIWPEPRRDWFRTALPKLRLMAYRGQPHAIELDAEGNWESEDLSGFKTLSDAAYYLMAELRSIQKDVPSIEAIELTTFPYHSEFGEKRTLGRMVDTLIPQCYSRWKDGKRPWDGRYGPGAMQRLGVTRARRVGEPRIVCGLAAWDQHRWPGKEAREGMHKALAAAVDLGCDEVRYWSWKHIGGHYENSYAAPFIASIGAGDDD